MAIYEGKELVDFVEYSSIEKAEEDFKNYDEPKGRTHKIEEI